MQTSKQDNRLLTVDNVADRLQCSTKTVRRLISKGVLGFMRVGPTGRLVRIPEKALAVYLVEQMR